MWRTIRKCRLISAGAVAASAAATLTPSSIAGLQSVTHELEHTVNAPSWGSTHELNVSLPQFDTQGGTRQLQSVDMTFLLGADQTLHFSGNPNDTLSIGTGTFYAITWTGLMGGNVFLPSPHGVHESMTLSETGLAVIGPLSEAFSTPYIVDTFAWEPFSLVNPDLLATLTGTGTLDITSQFVISELEYFDPTEPGRGEPGGGPGPGPEPPDIWDPSSFSIEIESLWMNASITYNYTMVPGSGVLSAFLMSGIAWRRRRRPAS